MSNSPILAHPLPEIRFLYFRGGVHRHSLRDHVHQHPFTLIGQVRHEAVWMQEGQNPPRKISAGSGYVLQANVRYRFTMEQNQRHEFRWAHVQFLVMNLLDLFQFIDLDPILPPELAVEVGEINARQVRISQKTDVVPLAASAERQVLGARLLKLLVGHAKMRPGARELLDGHARVLPVLRYMEERLDAPLTRGELAEVMHLSESQFHHIFRLATGVPPFQFLQTMRLRRAQELLLATDDSIAKVGQKTGFGDPFHFSRQFKASFGQSPRQYRVRARAAAI